MIVDGVTSLTARRSVKSSAQGGAETVNAVRSHGKIWKVPTVAWAPSPNPWRCSHFLRRLLSAPCSGCCWVEMSCLREVAGLVGEVAGCTGRRQDVGFPAYRTSRSSGRGSSVPSESTSSSSSSAPCIQPTTRSTSRCGSAWDRNCAGWVALHNPLECLKCGPVRSSYNTCGWMGCKGASSAPRRNRTLHEAFPRRGTGEPHVEVSQ